MNFFFTGVGGTSLKTKIEQGGDSTAFNPSSRVAEVGDLLPSWPIWSTHQVPGNSNTLVRPYLNPVPSKEKKNRHVGAQLLCLHVTPYRRKA